MYILIVGGGKVGSNLTSTLMKMGHEVTLLEGDRDRYALLEEKFEHVVRPGDATELFVLERAGVERADLVVAVTGDDEDNLIVCQVAKEKYGVPEGDRARQRPAQPAALRHARDHADRVGHRHDPGPDRARAARSTSWSR